MRHFFGIAQELLDRGKAVVAEPYGADSLYDLLNQFDDDIPFYLGLAKQAQGPVLEIGCGSGRVLHHLAEHGCEVVGLDLSPEMLRRARQRVQGFDNVQLLEGDMRSFRLAQTFDLIIMPYCTLIYTTSDAERESVFRRCYEHLNPGGIFSFDFIAGEVQLGEKQPYLALQGVHPFSGDVLVHTVQEKGLAPDLRLLNQVSYQLVEDGPAHITVQASLEAVCRSARIVKLLKNVGFSVQGVYTDHTMAPYAGGDSCLIVAQK